MKKITLSLAFFAGMAMMISCGGNATEEATTNDQQVEEAVPAEEAPAEEETAVADENTMDLAEGKALYEAKCQVCHQANGEGLPGAFPPLAKSDFLVADKTAAIKATINGLSGELTVNGVAFNSVMAPVPMSDEEILAVMNYVYNSWGNEGVVTAEDIAAAK